MKLMRAESVTEALEKISFNEGSTPFTQIRLKINSTDLNGESFARFLAHLKDSRLQKLELIFPADEPIDKALIDKLMKITPSFNYPVIILRDGEVIRSYTDSILVPFYKQVIENMRQYHQSTSQEAVMTADLDDNLNADSGAIGDWSKPIKMKALLNRESKRVFFDAQIPLEIEFNATEQEEEQVEIDVNEEENVYAEIEENNEIQEQGMFDGELIDFNAFASRLHQSGTKDLYSDQYDQLYATFRGELFANMPKAIKFVSEAASSELLKHGGDFATLNADNLPDGFFLKQTAAREWVLDYSDDYLGERKGNVFTPKVGYDATPEPFASTYLYGDYPELGLPIEIKNGLTEVGISRTDTCENLWIRYGEPGINQLLETLAFCKQKSPNFTAFLHEHYLSRFIHWDVLLDNPEELETWKVIALYEPTKLACLQEFITKTDRSTRFKLPDIVVGFEQFWREWSDIAEKNKLPQGAILNSWTQPKGGNPVVYMERLLTILNNARNVSEQLGHHDVISLKNYEGYYASKNEGFKVVTSQMHFAYDPDKQNQWIFNPEQTIFRTDLDTLLNDYKAVNARRLQLQKPPVVDKNNHNLIEGSYRYIGQQPLGVDIREYEIQLNKFLQGFDSLDYDQSGPAIVSLQFLTHERYEGKVPLVTLLKELYYMSSTHPEVLVEAAACLNRVAKEAQLHLSDTEGLAICRRFAGMNSAEFQSNGVSKEACIKKLFASLVNNRLGTTKFIQFMAKNISDKWPANYALDTAEFLSRDPTIDLYFRDNLLLFCALINTKKTEAYFAGKNDPAVLQNLEKIKAFLLDAATNKEHPNNYEYAYQLITDGQKLIGYGTCIAVYDDLKALELPDSFNAGEVERILAKNKCGVTTAVPTIFARDSQVVKTNLILFLLGLESYSAGTGFSLSPPEDEAKKAEWQLHELALQNKTIEVLHAELNDAWVRVGSRMSYEAKALLKPFISRLLVGLIDEEFARLDSLENSSKLKLKITELLATREVKDFDELNQITNQVHKLVDQFKVFQSQDNFKSNESKLVALFVNANMRSYDLETLLMLNNTLVQMSNRDYYPILKWFFDVSSKFDKETRTEYLTAIQRLHRAGLPSGYITKILTLCNNKSLDRNNRASLVASCVSLFEKEADDPILSWVLGHKSLGVNECRGIINVTENLNTPRFAIANLFKSIKKPSALTNLLANQNPEDGKIIQIMAMSHAVTFPNALEKEDIDLVELRNSLRDLGGANLDELYTLFTDTRVNLPCLRESLKTYHTTPEHKRSFQDLKSQLEKAPFGKRPYEKQFDIKQVERVVNDFVDLNHGSKYPYHRRKQMMEALLFINRAGYDLPIYNNQAAKDLSNKNLQDLFQAVKRGEPSHLDPFQRRLYALGLMREVMYRTTGQFAYSTQMLALIDCMMHEGDVISNIDTGQGKSLIDMMKASLLWLESDRVDLSTSSIVDAKRDLELYGPFLSLLGIPHGTHPITTDTSLESITTDTMRNEYKSKGINISTMAKFALFDEKMRAEGKTIGSSTDRVSLVMNESDFTILDDRTIYRYAATNPQTALTEKQEWVYEAINAFVQGDERFRVGNTTKAEDVLNLRQYLLKEAKTRGQNASFIGRKISNPQLLEWIESAILVNYQLQENVDYVITDKPITKKIRGVQRDTYAAKILQIDGKVSPDTQYGKGMQQLLYAKLNKEKRCNPPFVLEPQTKTIISFNNKNRIDYYRSKKGYIWGSSGTVGFGGEIDLQYRKYGFGFSALQPHQEKQVLHHDALEYETQEAHFEAIFKRISDNRQQKKNIPPTLVFLKDIETAKEFKKYLGTKGFLGQHDQLYTGVGDEEAVIAKAADPGMITITTPALGRNTDIKYPEIGMNVIVGFLSPKRPRIQMAGRTGRQGSKGQVDYLYNKSDYPGKTMEDVEREFEKKAEDERAFNEELFSILGYLLEHVDSHPPLEKDFFKLHWSPFSEWVEKLYRDKKVEGAYQSDDFLKEVVERFNARVMPNSHINYGELKIQIEARYSAAGKYASYNKPVKIKDCVSPDVLAYYFLNVSEPNRNNGEQEAENFPQEAKKKLKKLFSSVHNNQFSDNNNDYLSYLNTTPAVRSQIKAVHQEFLSDYLKQQAGYSQSCSGWFKRWLGFEGHLNRLINDSQYLMLFKALSSIRGEASQNTVAEPNSETQDLAAVKLSLKTLLKEYTQYNWFVSSAKKQAARDLIISLEKATSYQELVTALMDSKIFVMQQDITQYKVRYRAIFFGKSRFQTVLDQALKFTSAMSSQGLPNDKIKEYANQLSQLAQNGEAIDVDDCLASLDKLKEKMKSLNPSDKANAQVLEQSLETLLDYKHSGDLSTTGMGGRKSAGG